MEIEENYERFEASPKRKFLFFEKTHMLEIGDSNHVP